MAEKSQSWRMARDGTELHGNCQLGQKVKGGNLARRANDASQTLQLRHAAERGMPDKPEGFLSNFQSN
ncbi:hypothetical protein GCM10009077_37120 [Roseibium denhamense]